MPVHRLATIGTAGAAFTATMFIMSLGEASGFLDASVKWFAAAMTLGGGGLYFSEIVRAKSGEEWVASLRNIATVFIILANFSLAVGLFWVVSHLNRTAATVFALTACVVVFAIIWGGWLEARN